MNRAAHSRSPEALAENKAPHPASPPFVVMVTNDRQKFDRRVLLEADSLEAAGWKVAIVGLPLDPGEEEIEARAVRLITETTAAGREISMLRLYRRIRQKISANPFLLHLMRTIVWRVIADQENFYTRLYEKTLTQLAPDIFVAHDLPMLPAACAAARRCGAKLVYDSHELYSEQELSGREKRRWKEIEAKYIGACDRIITINPSIAEELRKRYGAKDVAIVYNAERAIDIPGDRKLFHKAFNLPDDDKILLYQGGLSANRHIETLVDCMRYVRDASVQLVVLGDGPIRRTLERIAKKNGLTPRVHFKDAVPQKDLLHYTACADAGVIPYQATCLNNYVCTPNKLFEFIAAGVPILANDLPEMRKFIAGYDIGMLGDMDTAEKLAGLIDKFFGDPARLDQWRTNTKTARRTVCWEQEEKKVVAILGDLL